MRVLIVDDSALFRFFLRELLQKDTRFEIIAEESNGEKAIDVTKQLKPDLIIMDIQMPVMDGITASQIIMSEVPTPIMIFSSAIDRESSFKAYQVGVIDVIQKPDIDKFNDQIYIEEFYERLFLIGKKQNLVKTEENKTPIEIKSNMKSKPEVIVIGASTGGPIAIRKILTELPGSFSIPIVIVQHLESGFENSFSNWLSKSTALKVKVVNKSEKLTGSSVFIAPTDRHLVIQNGYVVTTHTEKVLNQRPSVNVLFNSAADSLENNVVGVLLTGMGRDGAEGCKNIINHGGKTIVQDRESSVIYGMPKEAIESNSASVISPLNNIGTILMGL